MTVVPFLRHRAAGLALAAALAVGAATGCSTELPAEKSAPPASGQSVVGFLEEADENGLVLRMPDGSTRTFAVAEQDVDALDLEHLESHAGFDDVGFRVYYRSEGGADYAVGAEETDPPATS